MQVIIANDLAGGLVVFHAADGWTPDIDRAAVLENKGAAEAALQRAKSDEAQDVVVDPTLIEVRRDGSRLVPTRLRERIRAEGPTTGSSKSIHAAAAKCGEAA